MAQLRMLETLEAQAAKKGYQRWTVRVDDAKKDVRKHVNKTMT